MCLQKEGGVGSLSREVALERELAEAQERLVQLKADKELLEASVKVSRCPNYAIFPEG